MRAFPKTKRLLLTILMAATYSGSFADTLIEEVVVTAQKREESIQDVGISITAFTGEQIRELGYTNTTDITMQTPGVNVSGFNMTSLSTIYIRGISQSDFADHLEPPIATYVDGAYNSSMGAAHVQMFDVERVEILRGPQGTLFGRNATGGLIQYISAKPTQEFSGFGELTYAEYDQVKFQGAISGPLTDSVLGRLSVATTHDDGYVKSNLGGLFDQGAVAVRGQLDVALSEDLQVWLKVHYAEDDTNGSGYSNRAATPDPNNHLLGRFVDEDELAPYLNFLGGTFTTCPGCNAYGYKYTNDGYETVINELGHFEREIGGATGRVDWTLGDMTITSLTDYFTMDKELREDTDGSPLDSVVFNTDQQLEQFSQELFADGSYGAVEWTAGLYYLNIDTRAIGGLDPADIGPFIGLPGVFIPFRTSQDTKLDVESWAIYAQAKYVFSPEWAVLGGLRYTEDTKEIDYTVSDNFGLVERFNITTHPDFAEQDYSNVSGKAEVDWTPNDQTLVYASYSRGHKSGNFTTPYLGPIADFTALPHDEEVLTSYEVGLKATLLDGRVRLNANAFYYDYDDYQASFFINLNQVMANLDAEAYGGEFEITMQPTDHLELLIAGSLLETTVFDVGMPDGSIMDRELPYAPAFTLHGIARYSWPMSFATITMQADMKYSDDFCFRVVCHQTEEEDSYIVGNLRISATTLDDHWTVAAFVKNVGDEEYATYRLDASMSSGFSDYVASHPRWFGGSITYRW